MNHHKIPESGAAHTKRRNLLLPVLVIAAVAIAGIVLLMTNRPADSKAGSGNSALNRHISTTLNNKGELVLPLGDITDNAEFFSVTVNNVPLEVLAVKASDGSIRTAFNTCQVCFGSGKGYYVQEGKELVCQNCGNRFAMSDVQVAKGGCNPLPIPDEGKTVDSTSITIHNDYLAQATAAFANWKNA